MARAQANSRDAVRFVNDDNFELFDSNDTSMLDIEFIVEPPLGDDLSCEDDDSIASSGGLLLQNDNDTNQPADYIMAPKKTRNVYQGRFQRKAIGGRNTWRQEFAMSTTNEPHGRDATRFRRLFRVPHSLFIDLINMARERWWCDWTPDKVDASGRLVSDLELQLLGVLFILGNGNTHYFVSTQTNMSERGTSSFFSCLD